jgi:hypothetical protein
MANGGIPRRLTFELMREMHRLIWRTTGRKPHDHVIRCAKVQLDAYLLLFGDRLSVAIRMSPAFDGTPILSDPNAGVPVDQMQWLRDGFVVGVLADLQPEAG